MLVSKAERNALQDGKVISLVDLLAILEQNFKVTFLFKDEVVQNKLVNSSRIQIGEKTGQELSSILDQLDLSADG